MNRLAKHFLSIIFFYTGIFKLLRLVQNLCGRKLTVLTFHRIAVEDDSEPALGLPTISISTKNFGQLLDFIRQHYKIISLQDYTDTVIKQQKLPASSLLLSFDDGYRDVLNNAVPIMKKHDLPAVLFISTDAIDNGRVFWWDAIYTILQQGKLADLRSDDLAILPFLKQVAKIVNLEQSLRSTLIIEFIDALQVADAEIRERVVRCLQDRYKTQSKSNDVLPKIMSWEQIKECSQSGIDIGSHTVSHQFLTSVSDADAEFEIVQSKSFLENILENEIKSFSYPGGHFNDNSVELVKKANYTCGFTSVAGLNSDKTNRFKLKRINVYDDNLVDIWNRFSPAITAWSLFLRW